MTMVTSSPIASRLNGRAVDVAGRVLPLGDAPRPLSRRRPLGGPYRVSSHSGQLTGADFNSATFDGQEKYVLFREMWQSDPGICAALAIIEQPILASKWSFVGGDDEVREWLASVVMAPPHPQAMPWRTQLQQILLYRRYGNMLFEKVWYRTDEDRVACYLSPRPPETIWAWNLDGVRLDSVEQEYFGDDGAYRRQLIPASNLMHFVYAQEANNVEGDSALRSCYGEFISKREGRNLRNIMLERSTGMLHAKVKEDGRLAKGGDDKVVEAMRDFVAHEENYWVDDDYYEIEFLQTVSDGMDKAQAIMEYGDRIYMSRVLADFMNHGRMESGARASAEVQQNPFWAAMDGEARWIADDKCRREWFVPMVRANFGDAAAEDCPHLEHSDFRSRDAAESLAPIYVGLEKKAITPGNEALERFVLERAGAPQEAIDAVGTFSPPTQPGPPQGPPQARREVKDTDRTARQTDTADDEESMDNAGPPLAFVEAWTVDVKDPRASQGRLYRKATPAEAQLDLVELAQEWELAEARAKKLMDEFRGKQVAHVMGKVRKLLMANPATITDAQVEALKKPNKRLLDEYTRRLSAIAAAELDRGRADVTAELRFQERAVRRAGRPLKIERTPGFNPTSTTQEIRAQLRKIAKQGIEREAGKFADAAVTAAVGQLGQGVPNLQRVESAMTQLSRGPLFAAARQSVATGLNGGRHVGAVGAGAESMTYSTVLEDGNVCDACREDDGKTTDVGSPEYFQLRPPNRECFSETRGNDNQCRCFGIYQYDTEGAEAPAEAA